MNTQNKATVLTPGVSELLGCRKVRPTGSDNAYCARHTSPWRGSGCSYAHDMAETLARDLEEHHHDIT